MGAHRRRDGAAFIDTIDHGPDGGQADDESVTYSRSQLRRLSAYTIAKQPYAATPTPPLAFGRRPWRRWSAAGHGARRKTGRRRGWTRGMRGVRRSARGAVERRALPDAWRWPRGCSSPAAATAPPPRRFCRAGARAARGRRERVWQTGAAVTVQGTCDRARARVRATSRTTSWRCGSSDGAAVDARRCAASRCHRRRLRTRSGGGGCIPCEDGGAAARGRRGKWSRESPPVMES